MFSVSVFESVLVRALHTVSLKYGILFGGVYPQVQLISRYKGAALLLFSLVLLCYESEQCLL